MDVERYTRRTAKTPEQSRDRFMQLSAEVARLDDRLKNAKKELNKSYQDPKNKW